VDTSFDQNEFDLAYSDGVEDNYWSLARNRIILDVLKANNLSATKVIEVGCGKGIVTQYLADRGVDCVGIELAAVKPVNEKIVHTGKNAVEMSDEFMQQFQSLMLLDVIEHIEDPAKFIAELLQHYKHVTSILVTVPARKEMWSNYDEYYGHFRRYDLDLMKQTIRDIGFEVEELTYFFHSLYLPGRITVGLFKKRNLKMTPPKGVMKIVHKVIAAVMVAESKVLPKSWFGTSVLCVARRK
jgi:SAM-dependent methyltransferase